MNFAITFLPFNKTIAIPSGTLISEAAAMAEITALHLPCGGRGTCGKCTVQIAENNNIKPSKKQVPACTTRIQDNLTVWIEPKVSGAKSCIVASAALEEQLQKRADLTPLCKKTFVQTAKPGIEDNYSDLELLEAAIVKQLGDGRLLCSRSVLQTMAPTLREQNGKVTATIFSENSIHEIIALEAGDTRAAHYGIACDIGTTTISVRLIDLTTGKTLATESDYNGQTSRGADVISRIEYGGSAQKLDELRQLVLETINRLIGMACARSSISSHAISGMSIAGNSTMVHLFLGIPAKYLREHPYVPTVKHVPLLSAAECGLLLNPEAKVLISPQAGKCRLLHA